MYEMDEFKLYCGDDAQITDKIIVTIPTIRQIKEFGEKKYLSAVHTLTSVGADLKWQLWDMLQIDYTTIEDYDLFIKLISQLISSKKDLYVELTTNEERSEDLKQYSQEELLDMLVNPLQLTLKDIDFADFKPYILKSNNEVILFNPEKDITIDRMIYAQIVDVVRKAHGFKRNGQIPANETTKRDLIDDARDEAILNASKPYKSSLKPLVSALSVKMGCSVETVLDMKISTFFDAIKRVGKVQDATMLLQGAYSGFANLKNIDKSRLDWTADL